jgi:hypothetical protein
LADRIIALLDVPMFNPETVKVSNPDPKGLKELPVDFMVMVPGKSRWLRFQRYDDGLWNEMTWNGEWVWTDDVGDSTALSQWLCSEQAAVMMVVDEYGNCSGCGRSHSQESKYQDKCELCSSGTPSSPESQTACGGVSPWTGEPGDGFSEG